LHSRSSAYAKEESLDDIVTELPFSSSRAKILEGHPSLENKEDY
jgi:hypothetical protein